MTAQTAASLDPASLSTPLRDVAAGALEWLNAKNGSTCYLTAVIEARPGAALDQPFELGLVLCDGEFCSREQVEITPHDGGFSYALAARPDPTVPPLLDPPPGLRRAWLDEQLQNFDFLLLLFYRGRW